MSTLREDQEAEEVRPWQPGAGPKPAVHAFPYGQQPLMRVRVQGRWNTAVVLARHDHHDGRVAYQVDINLTIDGLRHVGTTRTYWWDPAAMKPLRSGTR